MKAKSKSTAEVAIIGAGPAGIACTIQLSRYGIKPLVFEKDMPGGLLKNANLVENFPGFPDGISGTALVKKLVAQLMRTGAPLIREKVTGIGYKNKLYKIRTDSGEYFTRFLVLSSGTRPAMPAGIRIPEPLSGKVFTEVYPLRRIKNVEIVIIGAGDAAFDYAIQLAENNKVLIMNRTGRVKCLPVLEQRAKSLAQISYFKDHVLRHVSVEPLSSRLKLSFQNGNKSNFFLADYIIFATGRRPELSFLNPGLMKQTDDLRKSGKLYLAGDVANDRLRQASIAYGDGMKAAMEIYLHENH